MQTTGAVVAPISLATTFAQDAVGDTRASSTPAPATRRAALEAAWPPSRARHGFAFASGLAAEDAVLRLLAPGQRVVLGSTSGRLQEILNPHLGVVHSVALLCDAYGKSFGAAMVAPGKAALSLTERLEVQNDKPELRHVDTECLEIRPGLAVWKPVPVIRRGCRELSRAMDRAGIGRRGSTRRAALDTPPFDSIAVLGDITACSARRSGGHGSFR